MNVAHLLTEAAKDRPHHTAISFEDRALAYEELDRLTDRAASVLAGIEAGRGEGGSVLEGFPLYDALPEPILMSHSPIP